MARIYVIRIERTDRDFIDPIHIRAESREQAESFVREMYGNRVVRVVRRFITKT